jgi:hypothetical protein
MNYETAKINPLQTALLNVPQLRLPLCEANTEKCFRSPNSLRPFILKIQKLYFEVFKNIGKDYVHVGNDAYFNCATFNL